MTVLSFYSRDFAICFGFGPDQTLSGLFATIREIVELHEFTGLYTEEDGVIDLVFYVDWKSERGQNDSYYSAFSGTISPENDERILTLDWMLVEVDSASFSEYCAAREPIIMTTSPDASPIVNDWPFPSIETADHRIAKKVKLN